MDSQENILETGKQVEVNQAAEAPEVKTAQEPQTAPVVEEAPEAPVAEEPQEERKVYETKKEVLDRVKEIAHGEETPQKEEVDYLKTVFYKLHIAVLREHPRYRERPPVFVQWRCIIAHQLDQEPR